MNNVVFNQFEKEFARIKTNLPDEPCWIQASVFDMVVYKHDPSTPPYRQTAIITSADQTYLASIGYQVILLNAEEQKLLVRRKPQ